MCGGDGSGAALAVPMSGWAPPGSDGPPPPGAGTGSAGDSVTGPFAVTAPPPGGRYGSTGPAPWLPTDNRPPPPASALTQGMVLLAVALALGALSIRLRLVDVFAFGVGTLFAAVFFGLAAGAGRLFRHIAGWVAALGVVLLLLTVWGFLEMSASVNWAPTVIPYVGLFVVGLDWGYATRLRSVVVLSGLLLVPVIGELEPTSLLVALAWFAAAAASFWCAQRDVARAADHPAPMGATNPPPARSPVTDLVSIAGLAAVAALGLAVLIGNPSCERRPPSTDVSSRTRELAGRAGAGGQAGGGQAGSGQAGSGQAGGRSGSGSGSGSGTGSGTGLGTGSGSAGRSGGGASGSGSGSGVDRSGSGQEGAEAGDDGSDSASGAGSGSGSGAGSDAGSGSGSGAGSGSGRGRSSSSGSTSSGSTSDLTALIVTLLALGVAVVIGVVLWKLLRTYQEHRDRLAGRSWAQRLVDEVGELGDDRGAPRERGETIIDYTARLADDVVPDPGGVAVEHGHPLTAVGRVLSAALFSGRDPDAATRDWAEQTVTRLADANPPPPRRDRGRAPAEPASA